VKKRKVRGSISIEHASGLIAVFSDETRLRLLSLIASNGEICVCDLMTITGLPQTKISKHLAVLRNAELVNQRREGTWMHYSMKSATTALHRSLLATLEAAGSTVDELQADLKRLKTSDCCAVPPKPIQIKF
jgi:ArsR family transcriptional regulator